MIQFEKISVSQILVFSQIINESSLMQKEFIKGRYLRSASNFDETFEFLCRLNLVEDKEGQVVLKPKFMHFLKSLKDAEIPKEMAKTFLIDYFATEKRFFTEYLSEFFSQFHLSNDKYVFTPTVSERTKHSGLRNLLIDLEFLYLDSSETKYVVVEDYTLVCAELKRPCQISPDEFMRIQQKRQEIGKAAELKIIEYEKERLSPFPDLVGKIEHTALKDVSAGYDIKSFDANFDKGEDGIPRFIEVKAVSRWNYGFNWTRNEIERSELYRQNYYLYLLPTIGKNKFDLKSLIVIRDPYLTIYKNKNKWTGTCELLSFSLSEGSKG